MVDKVEEIAEKEDNGESTLSNHAKFLTRSLMAIIVVFLLWLFISYTQFGKFINLYKPFIIGFLTVITGITIGAWICIKVAKWGLKGNLKPDPFEEMTEEACNDDSEPILHSCNQCLYYTLQICFFVYYCICLFSVAFAAYSIAQTTVDSIFIIAGKI